MKLSNTPAAPGIWSDTVPSKSLNMSLSTSTVYSQNEISENNFVRPITVAGPKGLILRSRRDVEGYREKKVTLKRARLELKPRQEKNLSSEIDEKMSSMNQDQTLVPQVFSIIQRKFPNTKPGPPSEFCQGTREIQRMGSDESDSDDDEVESESDSRESLLESEEEDPVLLIAKEVRTKNQKTPSPRKYIQSDPKMSQDHKNVSGDSCDADFRKKVIHQTFPEAHVSENFGNPPLNNQKSEEEDPSESSNSDSSASQSSSDRSDDSEEEESSHPLNEQDSSNDNIRVLTNFNTEASRSELRNTKARYPLYLGPSKETKTETLLQKYTCKLQRLLEMQKKVIADISFPNQATSLEKINKNIVAVKEQMTTLTEIKSEIKWSSEWWDHTVDNQELEKDAKDLDSFSTKDTVASLSVFCGEQVFSEVSVVHKLPTLQEEIDEG